MTATPAQRATYVLVAPVRALQSLASTTTHVPMTAVMCRRVVDILLTRLIHVRMETLAPRAITVRRDHVLEHQ